ncbi:MAG: pentapeptide repeat-containing protein [Rhizobiaceae bacterium]|nr:MAG: pentapeptide repeat-containing protein [Rhizobiaceae bacterium]CAG1016072.1 hypothetical protein RHIZO_05269 [Rhizobiaceae bacterium]
MGADDRQPWKPPFVWPPSLWRFTPAGQILSDAATAIIFLLVLSTVLTGIGTWFWLLWKIMDSLYAGESEVFRNYLLSLGALLGVPFLIWRTLIAAKQTSINRESLYTQLFSSGVERLGAEKTIKVVERTPRYRKNEQGDWLRDKDGNLIPALRPDGKPIADVESYERTVVNREVRLGAVYALERVALDSKRDSTSVLETLAEFVKNNNQLSSEDDAEVGASDQRSAIQAAISVIGRLPSIREEEGFYLDFNSIDLSQYFFDNGIYQFLSFRASKMLDVSLSKVEFLKCDFMSAEITSSFVKEAKFSKCIFYDAQIQFHELHNSIMVNCNFRTAIVKSVQAISLELRSCDFEMSRWYENKIIQDSLIADTSFARADMGGAIFQGTTITDCTFMNANLSFSRFDRCKITNTDFRGANLTGAKLAEDMPNPVGAFIMTDEELKEIKDRVPADAATSAFAWYRVSSEVDRKWKQWLQSLDASKTADSP